MIRKSIIVVLTLAAVGAFALKIDSLRTHYREYNPSWGLTLGSYSVSVSRVVNKPMVPPRSTWGDTPGRVEIWLRDSSWDPFTAPTPVRGNHVSLPGLEIEYGEPLWGIELSLWYLVVVFAAYPTLAFIRGPLRRYRRRKRGLCVTCGYDLRGSAGRCPECGTEIETT